MKPLIIIKIGGSVFACKDADKPTVDKETLKRLAKEIGEAYQKLKDKYNFMILHGAGSYGHLIVNETGIHKGIQNEQNLLDMAQTQKLQYDLDSLVSDELIKNNVPTFPIQASATAIMNGKKLEKMDLDVIKGLLDINMVPISYGVPAYDRKQKCSILSGDDILPFFVRNIETEKIIHATDVDGVYDKDPNKHKHAQLIEKINKENFEKVKEGLTGSSNVDVTGGMLNKIKNLLDLNTKSIIINGNKKDLLKKSILGKDVRGTVLNC